MQFIMITKVLLCAISCTIFNIFKLTQGSICAFCIFLLSDAAKSVCGSPPTLVTALILRLNWSVIPFQGGAGDTHAQASQ